MIRGHSLGAALAAGGTFDDPSGPNRIALSSSGGPWCYQIIPRTDFTFNVNGTRTQEILIAKRVDTLGLVSGSLLARVHSRGSWSTSATLFVVAQPTSYSPDEPQIEFINTAAEVLTEQITNVSAVPTLLNVQLSTPIPPHIRVLLRHVQGITEGACVCSLSVELYGRSA
jgi:hypothetical protein